ncbi:SH3 domain-containing protein [Desulfolutivibrio sp.]|uniref:SH3 domain-containing protein n=1 Tax=Desulfolutivibrio sp. TaxID=2773296 RepID=UPI002F9667BA
MNRRLSALVLVLFAVLAGCAPKTAPIPQPTSIRGPGEVEDLRIIPQKTMWFAERQSPDRPLLSKEQAAMRLDEFTASQFMPWTQEKPGYSLKSVLEPFAQYKKSPGFDEKNRPRDPAWAANVEREADLRGFPRLARRAVAVTNTNIRAMPTAGARFNDPSQPGEGYPFDYLQHSTVHLGTPLYVAHATRDGAWLLVETPYTFGWIPASDAAYVDEAFMREFMAAPLAAVIRDNVPLPGGQTADIGCVLPLAGKSGQSVSVLVPGSGPGGMAVLRRTALAEKDAAPMPLTATPRQIARVADQMMGQTYGWGGIDDKRDCSSMVRDLFAPFGIYLPRNSSAQAKAGPTMSLEGLTPAQKEDAIRSRAVPFATLVWMRGHIMLYVGEFQGKPAVYHNIWGLRTLMPDGREGRLVLGRAVITTLRAGEEVPEVKPERLLINRVLALTFLARPGY